MALVRISEFGGDDISGTVYEVLESIGLVKAINSRQYNITITGVQEKTPRGFIDDEPKMHTIQITKNRFMGNKEDVPFIKGDMIDMRSNEYDSAIRLMREDDLNFDFVMGIPKNEFRLITTDKDYVWYKHHLEITVRRGSKSLGEYAEYMFETIADMVVRGN